MGQAMKEWWRPVRYWAWAGFIVVVYAVYFARMVVLHTAIPYFDQASYITRVYYLSEAIRTAKGPALLDPDLYLSGSHALRPPLLLLPAALVCGRAADPRCIALLWLGIRLAVLMLAMILLARFFETARFVPAALLVMLGSAFFLQVHPFLYMMDHAFACFALLAFALVLWDLRRPSVRTAAGAAAGVLMLVLVKPEGAAFVAPMLAAVSVRGVRGWAEALRRPRRPWPWIRWSAVYLLLLVCLVGLWRSPYGAALGAHWRLAGAGYWNDDESLRHIVDSIVLIVPTWLVVLLATQLRHARQALRVWWVPALVAATLGWWFTFNLFAPVLEDRHLAAALPISATVMLAALCRIQGRAFKAATVVASALFVANLGIAAFGARPRWTDPLQFVLGPLAKAARPVREVGLLPLATRVRQEVELFHSPPERTLVLAAVNDEYVDPEALNLAMRRAFDGGASTIDVRHVPWGSAGFDLMQILEFRWYLTKQRRHAIGLQGDVWTSLYAVHNLINGPASPLHAHFEQRAEMPIRQPLAGPLGLFRQEPPDTVFEDTVTLWRLSKRPSIADSLAAMRWIVAAFGDTPGYPAVLAQVSRLEQVAAQGTGAQLIDEPTAARIAASAPPSLRGISFDGHLRLVGVVRRRTPSGLDVEIAWQSLHDQALDAMNFVHLLDGSSNVTDRLDYPQDAYQGTVKKGTLWRDVIRIPEARLLGARTIGLGVWRPPADVLSIEGGPRDWNGHRLLISIDDEVPRAAGSPPPLRR